MQPTLIPCFVSNVSQSFRKVVVLSSSKHPWIEDRSVSTTLKWHQFRRDGNQKPSPNICFIQLDLHTPCACNALVCARVDILDADLYNAFPHFLGTWSSCWAPSCLETSEFPSLPMWLVISTDTSKLHGLNPLKGEKRDGPPSRS